MRKENKNKAAKAEEKRSRSCIDVKMEPRARDRVNNDDNYKIAEKG
jgi:hypothetical protein